MHEGGRAEGGLAGLAKTLTGAYFHDGSWSSFRRRHHGRPVDTATLPGWTRFQPAEDWLKTRPADSGVGHSSAGTDTTLKNSFAEFMKFIDETSGRGSNAISSQNREAMFARFIEWRDKQAAAPGAAPAAGAAPAR